VSVQEVNNRYQSGFGNAKNPYNLGMDIKLLMDGKVPVVCPAESNELNDQAFKTIEEERTAQKEYLALRSKRRKEIFDHEGPLKAVWGQVDALMQKGEATLNDRERAELAAARQELAKAIDAVENEPAILTAAHKRDETEAAEERAIHIEREREVMRRVDEYDKKAQAEGKPLGHALVVYGGAHDFTKALEEWNAQSSRLLARGLIKIKVREDSPTSAQSKGEKIASANIGEQVTQR
jgi:hypothetical protein